MEYIKYYEYHGIVNYGVNNRKQPRAGAFAYFVYNINHVCVLVVVHGGCLHTGKLLLCLRIRNYAYMYVLKKK